MTACSGSPCSCAWRRLHQRRIPQIHREAGQNGPSVHLSHARPHQGLSGQPEGIGEHQPLVLPGRQDRRARRQRLGQVHAAAHHGRHRHRVRRRRLGRGGRARRLPAAGTGARRDEERARERHGGRRLLQGDPRPLQRDRRQLFRRDRRRDDAAAGRDRGQGPVGSRLQGRPGDGRAALPAGRCRRRQALGRRAAPRRAVQAAARGAGPAAARRADQPSRRRDRRLARRPPAQLSGRDPDRHPRPLLPRQCHGVDPGARPRPRHPVRGQLFVLARAEAEAARPGGPRGGSAPAHALARAGMGRGEPEGAAGEIQGALPALRGPAQAGGREADARPRRSSSRSPSGSGRTSSTSKTSRKASATTC